MINIIAATTMDTINKETSQGILSKKQTVIVMAGIMLEVFTGSMSQMIVTTAMPRIIMDLGGFHQYTWVVTIYLITSAVIMPLAGKLADLFGRKWLYILGIAIFIASSFLCGFSQTMIQLIVFRGFQGVGFGIMMTLGRIIMGDIFTPAERGKYGGFIYAVFGISATIGPALGGYLTDQLSWHWCFFINVPLGITIIILMIVFFPEMRSDSARHRIDFLGSAFMVLFIIPLMLALTWGGRQYAWLSPTTLGMFGFSALMLIFFLKQECVSQEPLIPLEMFKQRILSVSAVSVFILGVAFFSCSTFMPLFLQGVLGSTPTLSGMMTTPMILGMVVGGITSGQVLSRAGGHYRLQAAVGFALMGAGLFLLSRMTAETSYRTVVYNIILVGLGQGIILPLHMIAVQNAVSYSILGTATALLNLVRTLGGIFGLAVLGSAMNNVFYSEFMGNIVPGIKAAIQTDQLAEIANNPQALVSPEAQTHLKSLFANLGTNGQTLFDQMLITMQNALNSAIVNAFLIGFGAIALAFVINLFLEEIPLRQSIRDD